jgi:putative flippase GtrA
MDLWADGKSFFIVGIEPKIAMNVVYIIGASIGFIGNRKWTFAHQGNATSVALRYMLAHLLGYLLNILILFILVDHLGYAHQGVQTLAIIIVAGFLSVVFKYFVFGRNIARQKNMHVGFKTHYFTERTVFFNVKIH